MKNFHILIMKNNLNNGKKIELRIITHNFIIHSLQFKNNICISSWCVCVWNLLSK